MTPPSDRSASLIARIRAERDREARAPDRSPEAMSAAVQKMRDALEELRRPFEAAKRLSSGLETLRRAYAAAGPGPRLTAFEMAVPQGDRANARRLLRDLDTVSASPGPWLERRTIHLYEAADRGPEAVRAALVLARADERGSDSWAIPWLEAVLALLLGRTNAAALSAHARLCVRTWVRSTESESTFSTHAEPPPQRLAVLASEDLALAPPQHRGRLCSRVLEVAA